MSAEDTLNKRVGWLCAPLCGRVCETLSSISHSTIGARGESLNNQSRWFQKKELILVSTREALKWKLARERNPEDPKFFYEQIIDIKNLISALEAEPEPAPETKVEPEPPDAESVPESEPVHIKRRSNRTELVPMPNQCSSIKRKMKKQHKEKKRRIIPRTDKRKVRKFKNLRKIMKVKIQPIRKRKEENRKNREPSPKREPKPKNASIQTAITKDRKIKANLKKITKKKNSVARRRNSATRAKIKQIWQPMKKLKNRFWKNNLRSPKKRFSKKHPMIKKWTESAIKTKFKHIKGHLRQIKWSTHTPKSKYKQAEAMATKMKWNENAMSSKRQHPRNSNGDRSQAKYDDSDDWLDAILIVPGVKKPSFFGFGKSNTTVELKVEEESLTVHLEIDKGRSKPSEKCLYVVKKLPEKVIPEQCVYKIKDNQVVISLRKQFSGSWKNVLDTYGLDISEKS